MFILFASTSCEFILFASTSGELILFIITSCEFILFVKTLAMLFLFVRTSCEFILFVSTSGELILFVSISGELIPGEGLPEKYDGVGWGGRGEGVSENLRISFLEALYGSTVLFLSLCIFLAFEFDAMAVPGQFVLFTKSNCFEIVGKKRDCF